MPDSTLSAAITEAYANAPSDQVILHTLSLYHRQWKDAQNNPKALYFVRDHQPLQARIETGALVDANQNVTFTPAAFEVHLPNIELLPVPEIEVTLDNIGGEIMPYLDQAASDTEKVTLCYRPYLSSDTSEPQMVPPLELTLAEIQVTPLHIVARARMADMGNRQFPAIEYTTHDFPALSQF